MRLLNYAPSIYKWEPDVNNLPGVSCSEIALLLPLIFFVLRQIPVAAALFARGAVFRMLRAELRIATSVERLHATLHVGDTMSIWLRVGTQCSGSICRAEMKNVNRVDDEERVVASRCCRLGSEPVPIYFSSSVTFLYPHIFAHSSLNRFVWHFKISLLVYSEL